MANTRGCRPLFDVVFALLLLAGLTTSRIRLCWNMRQFGMAFSPVYPRLASILVVILGILVMGALTYDVLRP